MVKKSQTIHDNIDRDVIHISKSSLWRELDACRRAGSASANVKVCFSLAVTLIPSGLLADTSRAVIGISGSTIQGVMLGIGIAALATGSYLARTRDQNNLEECIPDAVIKKLTKESEDPSSPQPHVD